MRLHLQYPRLILSNGQLPQRFVTVLGLTCVAFLCMHPVPLLAQKQSSKKEKEATKALSAAESKAGEAPPLGILNLESWLQTRVKNLAITDRSFDPFGRPKDPTTVKVQQVIVKSDPGDDPGGDLMPEAEVDLKALFIEAVQTLNIGMVGNGGFMSQGRNVRAGEILELEAKGERFKAKVLTIAQDSIVFENTETGLKVRLPVGFSPTKNKPPQGTQGVQGMVPQIP